MLYDDGDYYNWDAAEGNDNPKVIGGKERDELNRTEGYEVLPFINRFIDSRVKVPTKKYYEKAEKIIRYDLPEGIHKHDEIEIWMQDNWQKCQYP